MKIIFFPILTTAIILGCNTCCTPKAGPHEAPRRQPTRPGGSASNDAFSESERWLQVVRGLERDVDAEEQRLIDLYNVNGIRVEPLTIQIRLISATGATPDMRSVEHLKGVASFLKQHRAAVRSYAQEYERKTLPSPW